MSNPTTTYSVRDRHGNRIETGDKVQAHGCGPEFPVEINDGLIQVGSDPQYTYPVQAFPMSRWVRVMKQGEVR